MYNSSDLPYNYNIIYNGIIAELGDYIRRNYILKKNANILLALMQLNIGGAETHVVELAKELKRKGFNVFVASNGGVYVKEIEEADIKHFNVPLKNINPLNMIRSA